MITLGIRVLHQSSHTENTVVIVSWWILVSGCRDVYWSHDVRKNCRTPISSIFVDAPAAVCRSICVWAQCIFNGFKLWRWTGKPPRIEERIVELWSVPQLNEGVDKADGREGERRMNECMNITVIWQVKASQAWGYSDRKNGYIPSGSNLRHRMCKRSYLNLRALTLDTAFWWGVRTIQKSVHIISNQSSLLNT
jgi:hypothetical protein